MNYSISLRNKTEQVETDAMRFLAATGMSLDEILIQTRLEKMRSTQFVTNRRTQFIRDIRLLNNDKAQEDMVGDVTLFSVHTNLMARSYSQEILASFTPTAVGQEREAQARNNVLVQDYADEEMAIMKYKKDFDKFLFGVGIIARTGWDGILKKNKFQVIDPMTWIPDQSGDYLTGNYAYTGFEKIMYMDQLRAAGYMNLDQVVYTESPYGAQFDKRIEQTYEKLIPQFRSNTFNPEFEIYMHFSHYKGIKACVITSNNEQNLLAAKIIEPSNRNEQLDPNLIRFPFAFYYWKPKRNDPFGYRVPDYVRDIQINRARMNNLRLKKAKAELYPMYLFNKNYVNSKDLNFGFNKFIPVDTGLDGPNMPLSNIVSTIQKDFRLDESITVDNLLGKQVEMATSIGEVTQGMTPEEQQTATVNSLVQSNTDINLSLNTKVNSWGERAFVRLWFNGYWMNFEKSDEKFVQASKGVGTVPLVYKRKDFLVNENMSIEITTSLEIEQKQNAERLAYTQTLPFILQSSTIPEASKNFALRRVMQANKVPDKDIRAEIPPTAQEMKQEAENGMLINGMFVGIDPDDDDLTHLVIVEAAGDGLEAIMHKHMHMQAYIKKASQAQQKAQMQPQQAPQGGQNAQQNGMMNNMASQAMSTIGQQSNQNGLKANLPTITP